MVDVIAPGRLLVRANGPEEVTALAEADPMLGAFLAFMDQQMCADPALFTAMGRAQVAPIESLVEGVDAECDTEFRADFRVP